MKYLKWRLGACLLLCSVVLSGPAASPFPAARLSSPDARRQSSPDARHSDASRAALAKRVAEIAEDKIDVKSLSHDELRAALVHARSMNNETAAYKITKELLRRRPEEVSHVRSEDESSRGERREAPRAMENATSDAERQQALAAQRKRREEAARKLEDLAARGSEEAAAERRTHEMREVAKEKLAAAREAGQNVVRVPSLPRVTLPPEREREAKALKALEAAENWPVDKSMRGAGGAGVHPRPSREASPPVARPTARPVEFGGTGGGSASIQPGRVGRTTSPPRPAPEELGLRRAPQVAPSSASTVDSELAKVLAARKKATDASMRGR